MICFYFFSYYLEGRDSCLLPCLLAVLFEKGFKGSWIFYWNFYSFNGIDFYYFNGWV